jgi:hypothetical protein
MKVASNTIKETRNPRRDFLRLLQSRKAQLEGKPMRSVDTKALLFSFAPALIHDFSDPTQSLTRVIKKYPRDLQDVIKNFEKSLRRFIDLYAIANYNSDSRSHLTAGEIDELQIRNGKCTNLEALRLLCLAEIKNMSSLCEAFHPFFNRSDIDHSSKNELFKLAFIAKPLLVLMEKLLEDDLDLNEEAIQKADVVSENRIFGAIRHLAAIHRFKSIKFIFDESLKETTIIRCNKIIRNLIFSNIIANAKRAMEQSEDAELQINIYKKDGYVVFEFRDNGCGMSEEIMTKLNFGERVTTKQEPGEHGIGFQYCRDLAKKMSGRLYVKQSEIGKGTTVVLEALIIADEIEG